MIRIYIDEDFQPGISLTISKDESHYLRVNRHVAKRPQAKRQSEEAGETIEAFNSRGQVAEGYLKEGLFYIERVKVSPFPIYPVTLALEIPDNAALESVVRSASELGAERLILFEGDRSQAADSRMSAAVKRALRIAKESMRQSARPRPLLVEAGKKLESLTLSGSTFFLDEVESQQESEANITSRRNSSARENPATVIVGPEGGWSSRERDVCRERAWHIRHYKTPILRVVTIVPVALFDMIRAGE